MPGLLDISPEQRQRAARGLLDILQGASNSAAGTLSGPVDLIAAGLRTAGVPVGNAPFGGSEWMRQVGLMREPQNRTAGIVGESIGNISPIVAAAKAPQIAQGLLKMGENARAATPMNTATQRQAGAIVWHGSPHKFDKFDASKIGTGEGAQAYGHGIYTAEARDVADQYRINLSYDPEQMRVGGRQINQVYDSIQNAASKLPPAKAQSEYEKLEILERLMMNNPLSDVRASAASMAPSTKAWFEKSVMPSFQTYGNLYKVDLPDEQIAKMLDWDKPLSQQAPGVLESLQAVDRRAKDSLYQNGGEYYRALVAREAQNALPHVGLDAAETAAQTPASQWLRQRGIPGIRYLDGGSRSAGAGTSNFVIFPGNEGLLNILERNGVPLK